MKLNGGHSHIVAGKILLKAKVGKGGTLLLSALLMQPLRPSLIFRFVSFCNQSFLFAAQKLKHLE